MWSCQHGDGTGDLEGDQEALFGPERGPFGIAVVGGPTAVIDIVGTRIVTDPTFDPPTDYGYLRKLAGPAIGAQALGQVDIVLLSHDLHPDNFDHAGRAFAMSRPLILTPPTAAAEVLGSQHIVVAHQDGWSHFREGPERTKAAFESAGTSRRLCAARAGHWCVPTGDGVGFPDAAR